jgi:hypothetical protein
LAALKTFLALAATLLVDTADAADRPMAPFGAPRRVPEHGFGGTKVVLASTLEESEVEALSRYAFVLSGSPEGQVLKETKNAKLTTFARIQQEEEQSLPSSLPHHSSCSRSHMPRVGHFGGLQVV